jgi:hypothetical protein
MSGLNYRPPFRNTSASIFVIQFSSTVKEIKKIIGSAIAALLDSEEADEHLPYSDQNCS